MFPQRVYDKVEFQSFSFFPVLAMKSNTPLSRHTQRIARGVILCCGATFASAIYKAHTRLRVSERLHI